MDETHGTYIHFACSGMSWYIQECAESIQAYQLTDCDSMNESSSHTSLGDVQEVADARKPRHPDPSERKEGNKCSRHPV